MTDELDLEGFWEDLLAYVEEQRVVPIIGPQLVLVEHEGTRQPLVTLVAARLAEKLRVDRAALGDNAGINAVVSAFVARGGRREEVYPKIRMLMRDITLAPPPMLRQLAEIGAFRLFVSLTWDSLLVDALNQARFAGDARTLHLGYCPARGDDLPRDWNGAAQPVVYSLLGKLSAAPEYAVTDEDVLEFISSLQSEVRRPPLLFDELRSNHLLVIGAAFPDWLSRFFLRVAKDRQLSLQRSEMEILVDPAGSRDVGLVSFFKSFSYGTRMLGQEPADFVAELHRRWFATHRAPVQVEATAAPVASASGTAGVATAPAPQAAPSVAREAMHPGSVFISYAKEDLPHVLKLKAALDKAGVEAWLDKERLEAGDMYDLKIRRYIKTCAVFVPVISRTTERRLEGYFRREWKLAAERAQGIAEHIPFILPVVVDDTPEYGASTPECFLAAQWTRVGAGGPAEDFVRRLGDIVGEYRRREGVAA